MSRTESISLLSSDRGYGTCEVDWAKANYSTIHKSYIISILIFCFFIPVMIMISSYVSIIKTVKSTNAMSADGFLTDRQRKVERDVTRVGSKSLLAGKIKACKPPTTPILTQQLLASAPPLDFHCDLHGFHHGLVALCGGVHVVGLGLPRA